MELDTLGDRKTALLFIITSDTDSTFNFVVHSILYRSFSTYFATRQMMNTAGGLPVHVRCLLDEFANIGQIPKFEKLIATIRSREISASIILQAQSQLKAIYKDNADTIVGQLRHHPFLGRQGENHAQRNIGGSWGKKRLTASTLPKTGGGTYRMG
jgi:type IV secretion system protein VirD4